MKYFISILLFFFISFFLGWQSKAYFFLKQDSLESKKKLETKTPLTLLEKIQAKKRLDVIILNSPTVYYVGADQNRGFEYELIAAYAKSIGVDLNLSVVYTVHDALKMSEENVDDITVAGITRTKEREQLYSFGPKYQSIKEQLVCNSKMYRNATFPKESIDLLDLKITVGKDTSYEKTLLKFQEDFTAFKFKTSLEHSSEELLEMVHKNVIDCTVVDSNIFMINQRYYPDISVAMNLSKAQSLAWVLRKGDDSLEHSLYQWFNSYENSGKMDELEGFYYSYLNLFDYYDNKIFSKRIKKRLPKYKKHFKQAGKKYGIHWELLAAQSYQESHWNPHAKSHTGVRGMMMLTLPTAKQMGVKNRLDAKESIFGGAKYLKKIEQRLDKNIKGKNRWAITLAAYNVGMGHIHDAQKLARKLNKNPYSWKDLKEILPLLSQAKYYKKLKYGYARGNEPVLYVDAILNYADIIVNN